MIATSREISRISVCVHEVQLKGEVKCIRTIPQAQLIMTLEYMPMLRNTRHCCNCRRVIKLINQNFQKDKKKPETSIQSSTTESKSWMRQFGLVPSYRASVWLWTNRKGVTESNTKRQVSGYGRRSDNPNMKCTYVCSHRQPVEEWKDVSKFEVYHLPYFHQYKDKGNDRNNN